MKRSVLLLVPVFLVAALAVPASASGAGWSITPSPNPRVPTGQLFWVSCPAVNSCMAVGTYTKPSGPGVNLAEQWNGHSWRVLPIPNPPGAAVSNLLGVSCTSPSACTAVGVANPSSSVKTLAERWNGTRWSIQATPSPPHGSFNAVSCTSASACTAVGASSAGTLAESWNGTRWTIQRTANPKRGGGFLSGVSCTSASACTAVGASDPFTPTAKTLAERWNGSRWSIQATPNPSQGGGELLSVSCASASVCTATGNSNAGTLGAQWNGASWSLRPTPTPAGSTRSFLNSVSCTSPSACTAVGAYQTSSGVSRTLAARWNGAAWRRQATPSPTGQSVLIGVACASGTACTAVGYTPTAQTPAAVAEQWNGSTWKAEPAPSPLGAASSTFNSVACTATSACIAVGATTSRTRQPQVSLAERWDGHSWRLQQIPSPASGGALIGVSCTSPSACTAVGAAHPNALGATTLAERWNGNRWSIQATPDPAGAAAAALLGVSCTSGSSCMAVGTIFNSSGNPAGIFSERWDGTRWHLQAAPMPMGSPGSLFTGVACTSPSSCTAVGFRTDGSGNAVGTLAERWNGTRWSIQSTPNPAPGGVLAAVSCTSAVACTAAGNLNGTASAGTTTLVERWNGTKWAIQPTPKLSAGQGSFFNGVACTAGACTAVGLYLTPSGPLTLAEQWTGTGWRIQATPTPSQAYDLAPPAVACPTRSACIAVGGYTTNTPALTLAEQWNGTGQPLPRSLRSSAAAVSTRSRWMGRAGLLHLVPRSWSAGPSRGWRQRSSGSPGR